MVIGIRSAAIEAMTEISLHRHVFAILNSCRGSTALAFRHAWTYSRIASNPSSCWCCIRSMDDGGTWLTPGLRQHRPNWQLSLCHWEASRSIT